MLNMNYTASMNTQNEFKKAAKYAAAAAVIIALAAIAYSVRHHRKAVLKHIKSTSTSVQDKLFRQYSQPTTAQQGMAQAINGLVVPANQVHRPFAAVVENLQAARPQSGLSQADVVYEALAEGGITRYLAVFQTQNVDMIGPVRSARTYFNDWAQELGAIYAHVGGNSDALYYIKQGLPGVSDADQMSNDPFFWRTSDRKRPHNTYTSVEKLFALAQAYGYSLDKNYQDWVFKDDAEDPSAPAKTIDIQFSMSPWAVEWNYDPTTNTYKRILAGKPDIDRNNNVQIHPKTVVVQFVRNWPVASDTLYAISMGTREGGQAYVFEDGKEILGTWKVVDGKTRFYDQNGNEIAFDRGQLWLEMVPPGNRVAVK